MCCITETKKARAIPLTQSIDLNGEQFYLFPVLEFVDTVGHKWRKLHEVTAERRQPSLPNLRM